MEAVAVSQGVHDDQGEIMDRIRRVTILRQVWTIEQPSSPRGTWHRLLQGMRRLRGLLYRKSEGKSNRAGTSCFSRKLIGASPGACVLPLTCSRPDTILVSGVMVSLSHLESGHTAG